MTDLPSDARVLVTGANGFVGSRICRRLSGAGTDVRAMVRRQDADLSAAGGVDIAVAALGDRVALEEAAAAGVQRVVHVSTTSVVGDDAIGQTYVVAAGTTTWGEFLDEVVSWFPGCEDPLETAEPAPTAREWSSARIRDDLGWQPTRSFTAAMAEAAEHHA